MVNSGYVISDPTDFAKRFYRLYNGALGIPRNAPVEEVQVDIEDDDEDDDENKKKKDDSDNIDDKDNSDDDDKDVNPDL